MDMNMINDLMSVSAVILFRAKDSEIGVGHLKARTTLANHLEDVAVSKLADKCKQSWEQERRRG